MVGLEVPHAHIHLIPINKESDMYFDKEHLQLPIDELSQIANQIAANF